MCIPKKVRHFQARAIFIERSTKNKVFTSKYTCIPKKVRHFGARALILVLRQAVLMKNSNRGTVRDIIVDGSTIHNNHD